MASCARRVLLAGGAVGRSPASAGGSPYHPHGAGQAAQGRRGSGGGAHGHGHGHANGGGHDDEDGYSDDFEEDDEGGDEVLQQRNRIIQNVEDIATRAYDGRDSIAAVQERVLHTGAKTDKTRALRQNCAAALGSRFSPIYDYLSRVRSQNPAPDEKEVQRRLLEMVGDKSRLQACFMVDQLVFTEQMYA